MDPTTNFHDLTLHFWQDCANETLSPVEEETCDKSYQLRGRTFNSINNQLLDSGTE